MSAVKDSESLKEKFGDKVVETVEFRGEHTVVVELSALAEVLATAKNDLGYDFLLDISSLDHFGEDPRFEMVYELATTDDSKHLRIRAKVGEDQEVPTAVKLWDGAEWHEREVYDMMGIRFADHPDLRRILMWEGYPFHPLRKDFPLAGRPSEMPDVAFTGVAPLEGGPFVTSPGSGDPVSREPRSREID
ncbi:NADH-quinone oxidoreductase subunit C [Haloferula helveola]|uniref:NADH-quinone oxidoreductase subunit C n=1 Tax=Haloferula helveola TaxID=490095 RepID=A0ABN6H8G8_9BACT|nr:NADH-quinone oxidoreductase subunit C [Haloferula helveola]